MPAAKLEQLRYNEAEDVPYFRKWGCNISEQTGSIPAGTGKSREDGGESSTRAKQEGEIAVRKIRITVMRKACYRDLMEKYENPIEHACDMDEGQVFIANGWERPDGLCESAWETMSPFVMGLAHGAEDFYDGWMKNPRSAMISCNDGFRPVSFLLEVLDEE